jgi:hypothetical protein
MMVAAAVVDRNWRRLSALIATLLMRGPSQRSAVRP